MIGRIPAVGDPRRLVAIVAIAALVAACSGSAGSALAPVGEPVPGADQGIGGFASAAPSAAEAQGRDTTGGSVPGAPDQSQLLVIKTGTLALEVKDLEAAVAAASAKIAGLGGYVSGSQRSGDAEKATAQVTYRIPASQWDAALVALRALGTKVLAEQTQTEEVTGQVVDLAARIDNLQATERALQAIMAKAIKISDVLEVQAQLTDTRGQIEQLTSQKKHLEEQAAYSTLTVTYGLPAIPAVTQAQKGFDPAQEVDRATASLVDILQGLAGAGIWFGIVWLPILVVLVVLGAIALAVLRRLGRRFGGTGNAGGASTAIWPSSPGPGAGPTAPAAGA